MSDYKFAFKSKNGKDIFISKDGKYYWKDKNGRRHPCRHGKKKNLCKDGCGGVSICPCGRRKTVCAKHGGGSLCKCGMRKTLCPKHGGSSLCPCGKQKPTCAKHGGASLCPCGISKIYCREHGDTAYCKEHGVRKDRCHICSPNSNELCSTNGCWTRLGEKRRKGSKMCARCTGFINKQERHEYVWLEKFKSWGFFPSVHDKIIKASDCKVVNKRRVDYLFITDDSSPHNILCECDEQSHRGIAIECEMKRLQEVCDQIFANTCVIKPLLVIRFNPDSVDDIEDELYEAMCAAFKGSINVEFDDRGICIFKLIGYSSKRKSKYKHITGK